MIWGPKQFKNVFQPNIGERCRNGRITKLEEWQLGFGVTLNRFPFAHLWGTSWDEWKKTFPMFVIIHMFFPKFPKCVFFFGMPLCLPKLYCTLFFCMRSVPANGWHICGQVTKTFQGVTSECFSFGNNDETKKNVLNLSLWSICIQKIVWVPWFPDHGLSQKSPEIVWKTSRWGRRCCATATCWKSCTLSSPPKWETLTWCGREGNQGRYLLNPFRKGSLGAIPQVSK